MLASSAYLTKRFRRTGHAHRSEAYNRRIVTNRTSVIISPAPHTTIFIDCERVVGTSTYLTKCFHRTSYADWRTALANRIFANLTIAIASPAPRTAIFIDSDRMLTSSAYMTKRFCTTSHAHGSDAKSFRIIAKTTSGIRSPPPRTAIFTNCKRMLVSSTYLIKHFINIKRPYPNWVFY